MGDNFDQASHDKMWHHFTRLLTVGTVCCIGVLCLMGLFLL